MPVNQTSPEGELSTWAKSRRTTEGKGCPFVTLLTTRQTREVTWENRCPHQQCLDGWQGGMASRWPSCINSQTWMSSARWHPTQDRSNSGPHTQWTGIKPTEQHFHTIHLTTFNKVNKKQTEMNKNLCLVKKRIIYRTKCILRMSYLHLQYRLAGRKSWLHLLCILFLCIKLLIA